ncbi:acyl-CoA dehydrogenase [Nitzschia inconspicua]|uniref:Short/branched chain specific acyl-CoA dehydrogenase, mitochondrial n=1 Tax=Nitzschia inconspicua TaxID=303405 RepID=A0A9K3Q5Q0_9STRA|nr:acyl-CoA dehydrogenase [Nitzschia inconspicua]
MFRSAVLVSTRQQQLAARSCRLRFNNAKQQHIVPNMCFGTQFSKTVRVHSLSTFSTEHLDGDGRDEDTMIEASFLTTTTRQPITTFTEDETMTRDAVRQWAREMLRPQVRAMDTASKLDPAILNDLFAQGYMGLEIPHEFGGSGLTFTAACLTVEEISRVDPSVAILVDIHNTLTNNAVRFWGSTALQEEWLPRLATECVSSFCLSEAGSGSDAFAMKTTATPSGDGSFYTLQGNKLWISNAREAGVLLVFANADPSQGYKGITAFMVDAETPGITIGQPEDKLGLKASSTCPIHFDNVKVESSHILGEVGQGYKYCINILNEGRIGIAAQQIGIAKGCMDIAMPYLLERKQFGTALADFQGMQHQYAQIATEIHAAEVMTYNACRRKEAGLPFVKEASMVKLYSSQVAEKAASKTIEWLGGIGFTKDLLAEKFYRDCKVGSIYEGTSNIQLQTIAKILQQE